AKSRRKSADYWLRQLEKAKHTRSRIESAVPSSGPRFFAANSSRLDRAAGENWLAIGDAAMAFDPLSGQGVYKALQSACRAAEAIHQHSTGNTWAFQEYAAAVAQDFDSYQITRRAFYSRERRWPCSAFWQRRSRDLFTPKRFSSSQ